MGDGRLGLFTVGLQYTLARRAEPLAIALQAAKNGEDVALVGPQLRHAVSGHIAMTGRAVLLTSLHRARTLRCRRLRWELGRGGRDAGQQQGQAQNQSAMHDFRSPTAKPLPVDSVAHVPRSRMSRTSCHSVSGELLVERLAPAGHAAIHLAAGRVAQLVERLLYTQDVGGSSPSPPTTQQQDAIAAAHGES